MERGRRMAKQSREGGVLGKERPGEPRDSTGRAGAWGHKSAWPLLDNVGLVSNWSAYASPRGWF